MMGSAKAMVVCFVAILFLLFCMCSWMAVRNQKMLDKYAEVRTERLYRMEDAIDRGYVWYKDGRELSQDEIKLVVVRDESFVISINDETQEVTVMECSSETTVPRLSLLPVFMP